MPHGMENGLVDDETREALELTKDELVEMLDAGEPAVLVRQPPRTAAVTMHSSNPEINKALNSTNCGQRAIRTGRPRRTTVV